MSVILTRRKMLHALNLTPSSGQFLHDDYKGSKIYSHRTSLDKPSRDFVYYFYKSWSNKYTKKITKGILNVYQMNWHDNDPKHDDNTIYISYDPDNTIPSDFVVKAISYVGVDDKIGVDPNSGGTTISLIAKCTLKTLKPMIAKMVWVAQLIDTEDEIHYLYSINPNESI